MQLVLKIILLSTLVGLGYSKPHRFNSFDSNTVISNTGLGKVMDNVSLVTSLVSLDNHRSFILFLGGSNHAGQSLTLT